tara:strand:- start:48557 stop:48670 length:114 start_codon:yes stop_codon:yes gene_type:complete
MTVMHTREPALTREDLVPVLLASASIPLVMSAVARPF